MCRDYSSINMLMNYKYYIDEPINLNKPNQNSDYFNINSHGFRGQEVNSEKQDNTFRIFFVGGSSAFGYVTMSDDSTISGFLETKLDESIKDIGKQIFSNLNIKKYDSKKVRIFNSVKAETKQAISTLFQVGRANDLPYVDFPNNELK